MKLNVLCLFALGQAAGTAAAIAIDANVAVQQVDYTKLAARLTADGQIIALPNRG